MTDQPEKPKRKWPEGVGHGPAKGAGHGGPAKGVGCGESWWPKEMRGRKVVQPMTSEYAAAVRAMARDPKAKEAREALRNLALTTWVQVAQSSEYDSARVQAADKIAKRVGLPEEPVVTVNINRNGVEDLTDEQLDAEIARLQRAVGRSPSGEGEEDLGEPAGGV